MTEDLEQSIVDALARLGLAGKDYLTEKEAAAYCCVSADRFLVAAVAYELAGPKYRRSDLAAMMEEAFSAPAAHRQRLAAYLRDYVSARRLRTPAWADRNAIRLIYARARELTTITGIKYAVDHVLPLRGTRVSGLHVHNNLQIITLSENSAKGNRFTPK